MTQDLLKDPIIFIGPGRSGSTIISEIILAHESLAWPSNYQEYFPRVLAVNLLRPLFDNSLWQFTGEKGQLNRVRFLNNLLPRPAEAFPFWQQITRDEIDFSRGFLLGETAQADERERIRRAVGKIVRWQGRQRFAMKLTGPGRIGYLHSIFPDACFVNVVRDPVATVNSLLKVPFWKELGMHRLWWTGAYSEAELEAFETFRDDPVAVTAFQLNKVLQTTLAEAEACQAKMLTLPYETFVEDPRAGTESLCHFLNLDLSPALQQKLSQTSIHDQNRANAGPAAEFAERVRAMMQP